MEKKDSVGYNSQHIFGIANLQLLPPTFFNYIITHINYEHLFVDRRDALKLTYKILEILWFSLDLIKTYHMY